MADETVVKTEEKPVIKPEEKPAEKPVETPQEVEVPSWVNQPPQIPQPQAQYVPQPVQQPQTIQQQPPQYPQVNVDDLVAKPGQVMYEVSQRAVSPYVERVNQLDQFMRQSFDSQVGNAARSALGAIDSGYRNILSRDPAFGNKSVKQTVDSVLQNQFNSAVQIAHTTGDFSALNNFANPKYMQMVLAGAKIHVGYPGGETPGPINIQGAYTESSRSVPVSAGAEIPDEVRDAANRLGIEPGKMWTDIQAAEKKQRDLGWVKK